MLRIATLLAMASIAFADEPKTPVPKFKLAKDTTFVDGPLDAEGYVDYETAANKLLKGKIAPETNAFVLLLRCLGPNPERATLHADFYKALGVEEPPVNDDVFLHHSDFFRQEWKGPKREEFEALDRRISTEPWTVNESPRHAAYLEANDRPLQLALAATLRKEYYYPLVARPKNERPSLPMVLLPHIQQSRQIANVLAMRAMLSVGTGKTEAALADALAMNRLGRLMASGGCLIEVLVGYAIDRIGYDTGATVLEHGKPTARQSLAYCEALASLPPMPEPGDKIELMERFILREAIQNIGRDGFQAVTGPAWGPGAAPAPLVKGELERLAKAIDYEAAMRETNARIDRIVATMRIGNRADSERGFAAMKADFAKRDGELKSFEDLRQEILEAKDPGANRTETSRIVAAQLYNLLKPSFQKMSDARFRNRQHAASGRIAAALAAHKADEKKHPDALADLVPKYLNALPDDVFTGKPLVYKKTEKGYLFYSVGVNGMDDGGAFPNDAPPGDDIGVRVPGK